MSKVIMSIEHEEESVVKLSDLTPREEELLRRLTTSNIGKTLIFVTHRPAVLKYCTNILRIEKSAGQ